MKIQTSETRVQKLTRFYAEISSSPKLQDYYSWGGDTDRILSDYPELTTNEGILISAYLERCYDAQGFQRALQDLGII